MVKKKKNNSNIYSIKVHRELLTCIVENARQLRPDKPNIVVDYQHPNSLSDMISDGKLFSDEEITKMLVDFANDTNLKVLKEMIDDFKNADTIEEKHRVKAKIIKRFGFGDYNY